MSTTVSTTDDTQSTEPSIDNNDSRPFINSDLLIEEANEENVTDKQRRVLLAASALYDNPDVSFSMIARNAGVSTTYVRYVLVQHVDRTELPADCRIFDRCTPNKTYDDLTSMQRQIVNELALNDDISNTEVADRVECTVKHVQTTGVIYGDIVQQKRYEHC